MADSLRKRVIAACSARLGSAEDYSFGDEVAVFKIAGKMFALTLPGAGPRQRQPQMCPGSRGRAAPLVCRDHRGLPPQQAALEHNHALRLGTRG